MNEATSIIRKAKEKMPQKAVQQDYSDVDVPYNNLNKAFRNKIKKMLIIGGAVIFSLIIISIIANHVCIHNWTDATCARPITCVKCGKQKGEALGHTWVDATCTKPKTCSVCKKTTDNSLGHDVEYTVTEEATCSKAGKKEGVCKRCNEKISQTIPKIAHKPSGKWEITEKATFDSPMGMRVQYCTVCGEIAKEETYTLTETEKLAALKSACKSYSYKEISRNPDSYSGKYAYFKGEVVQVVQDASFTQHAIYRVSVTNNGYFWTDAIMVVFEGEMEDGSRLIEDDIVKMYGKLDGMYTYETVMGDSLTIPLFRAQHIERVN